MGAIWELFQEYQISKRSHATGSLEGRVEVLENELEFVESLLEQVIPLVENLSGQEIQSDLE